MFFRHYSQYLVIGMCLLAFCVGALGQTKVFKWVDEDGGLWPNGTFRPRMFDDLPECVEALQETNRRRR